MTHLQSHWKARAFAGRDVISLMPEEGNVLGYTRVQTGSKLKPRFELPAWDPWVVPEQVT